MIPARIRPPARRGVTLLELLVAMALLGLLAGAAVPALSNLLKKTALDAATTTGTEAAL